MTVQQIITQIRRRGKRLSRPGLYKHFRALNLKPRGVARPAIYPKDAAKKVIARLGLNGSKHSRS